MDSYHWAVTFAAVSYSLIFLEGVLAYFRGMLTPGQMQRSNRPFGMPWLTHGGAFFGDAFLVTPAMTYVIYLYGGSWHLKDHWLQIALVWLANWICHRVWSKQRSPDCLACYGRLEPAGYPHFVFMGTALTVVFLFYFDTTVPIDPKVLTAISLILCFHVFLGVHGLPSLWNLIVKHVPGVGHPLTWWRANTLTDPNALATLAGCWVALGLRTHWILTHQ